MNSGKLRRAQRRLESRCRTQRCGVKIDNGRWFCLSCKVAYGKGAFVGGLAVGIIGGLLKIFHVL